MIEQNIKTRLQLKIDTSENWEKATGFIPKKGEPIVYQDEAGILLKIGDGARVVNELPFSGNAFVATYGVTAFEEIYSAHAQGRYVILNDIENNYLAQLIKISSEMITFSTIDHLRSFAYEVTWENLWTLRQLSLENSSNKITNLNGSTHQYYPTAKAVTDYIHSATDFYYYNSLLQAIEDINNHVWNGATTDLETAKVKVFTADNGVLTVMLLDDDTFSEKILISKDINLVLNGKVLAFTDTPTAGLSFAEGTSCYIDGTVSGSAINKNVTVAAGPSTGKTYPAILVRGDSLTINGGSYNVSGNFYAEDICVIGNIKAKLTLENCSISIVDSDSAAPSYIYGLLNHAPATLRNVVINADTANGKASAIQTKHNLEIYDSNISSITRPKWAKDGSLAAYGIFAYGDNKSVLKIKDSIIHTDAQNDSAEGTTPYAIGILLYGNVKGFLENTNVTGTHSGIQCGDKNYEGEELYVKGGILKSFAHGGIYAVGGSKVCVRDAILRCGAYDGIFDYTSDKVFESNYLNKPFSNLYVSGDNTTVYLDGCSLDSNDSRWCFVIKNGANSVVNISNSTVVEGTEKIRLDNDTFRANVGIGTNLTPDSFFTPHLVTFTEEIYRVIHEDEVCNGNDYDALIKLNAYSTSKYYATLSQAIEDINNDTAVNALAGKAGAKVEVFTTEDGILTVKLLDNISESTVIDINKDINLVLNGKTITLSNEAAYLNFNTDASCVIDGTINGSTISKTVNAPTANCQAILVNGNSLLIDGGLYNINGAFGSKIVMFVKTSNTVNHLALSNCSIIMINTGTTTDSNARVIQSQAANTTINNVSISTDTYGATNGLMVAGKVEIINSNIDVKTRSQWGTMPAYGIYNFGANLKIKDSIIHTDSIGCDPAHPFSVGIYNDGITLLNNTNVTGTYCAVETIAAQDELYVNGGVLTGYYFGGTRTLGLTCIRDAVVRCGNYDGIFDYTSEDKFTSGYLRKPHCNLYIAGTGTNVYLDGCTLTGDVADHEIAIKGDGKNAVNISNSNVFDISGKRIAVNVDTNRLNVGVGTNITAEMANFASRVEFTDQLYRKLHRDEACNGSDYNTFIAYLNHVTASANSYVLNSSTENSDK